MKRWISILATAGAVGLATVLAAPELTAPLRVRADAGAPPADAGGDVRESGSEVEASAPDAGTDAGSVEPSDIDIGGDAGLARLPDRTPKTVRCGVILVTFAGAQGAPKDARSRAEAKSLAEKLAIDARSDFHGAVVRGDSGSADDIGRIPRGVLEVPLEYALFTLPSGGVSDPIEAPRGFWIAKRLE